MEVELNEKSQQRLRELFAERQRIEVLINLTITTLADALGLEGEEITLSNDGTKLIGNVKEEN